MKSVLPILLEVNVAGFAAAVDRESSFDEQFDYTGWLGEGRVAVLAFGQPDHGWVAAEKGVGVSRVERSTEGLFDVAIAD